jgi:tryptophanase
VYTQSHVDYVAEVIRELYDVRHDIRGARITSGPSVLRHFTARFSLHAPSSGLGTAP